MDMKKGMEDCDMEMEESEDASPKDKILEEFSSILDKYFPESKEVEKPVGEFDKLMMAHKKGMK